MRRPRLAILLAAAASLAAYLLTREWLDERAARAAAILVAATVLWATEAIPLFATAFLVIGLEIVMLADDGGLAGVLTGLLEWIGFIAPAPPGLPGPRSIPATAFLQPFASDIVILFMGGFLISRAMTRHGVDLLLARRLMHGVAPTPARLLAAVLGVTAFLSMWMSNTATAAMMLAVVLPLVRALPPDEPFRLALMLAVPFGANLGGLGTPIGTPPNAIAYGALNRAGYDVTFLEWAAVAAPLEIALLLAVWGLLYWSGRPRPGLELPAPPEAPPLTREGAITLATLAGAVALWLTSGWHGVGPGAVALVAAAGLAAMGVLVKDDLGAIDWSVLILMWGGLSLAVAVEASGLTSVLATLDLTRVPGGLWGMSAAVAVTAMVLSTFMSNTATAALVVPMALALDLPSREQVAMLAALACSFAMAMPVSTPPNAMAYGTGEIPLARLRRIGALVSIVSLFLLLAGYRLMLPLIFP